MLVTHLQKPLANIRNCYAFPILLDSPSRLSVKK